MLRISTVCLLVLGLTGTAFAEPVTPAEDEGAQVIVTEVQDPNQPQVQVVEQEESYAQQGRGLQYGASLIFPIWLSDLGDQFNPGVGIAGRIGWEIGGGLSLELGGGITWNGTKSDFADAALLDLFLQVGARYAILNPSRFLPFFQAGIGLNFWNYCEAGICSDYSEITFGLFGGAGLIYEINMNAALELGLNFQWSAEGDVFAGFGSQFALSPFVGITLYY
jgi:hypothetical protein